MDVERTKTWRSPAAALCTVVALTAACGLITSGDPDERDRLADNRAVWAENALEDYSYRLQRKCFCAFPVPEPVTIRVRAGAVVSVSSVETGESAADDELRFYHDVDGLFDVVEGAIDREAASLEVEYHATLGYPTMIDVDYQANAVDDEIRYEASALSAEG